MAALAKEIPPNRVLDNRSFYDELMKEQVIIEMKELIEGREDKKQKMVIQEKVIQLTDFGAKFIIAVVLDQEANT